MSIKRFYFLFVKIADKHHMYVRVLKHFDLPPCGHRKILLRPVKYFHYHLYINVRYLIPISVCFNKHMHRSHEMLQAHLTAFSWFFMQTMAPFSQHQILRIHYMHQWFKLPYQYDNWKLIIQLFHYIERLVWHISNSMATGLAHNYVHAVMIKDKSILILSCLIVTYLDCTV